MDYILEILGRIGFDWRMGAFNLINFLIIFWILKRYAFKPVLKVINERQEKIREGVDNAQKAKTELGMAEKKSQEIIDEAKGKANKIVEDATLQTKDITDKMKAKAKEEIEVLVAQAKTKMEIDKKDMLEQVRKESGQLVVAAVEKILGEKMDGKKDEKFISEMLSTLK